MRDGELSLIFTNIPEPPNMKAPTSNRRIPLTCSFFISSAFKILSYTFSI